jgi:hypothetical protein
MSLTEQEKERIVNKLGDLEDTTRRVVLASLEAFSSWVQSALYAIYIKIKDGLGRLWRWIVDQFA